MSDIEAVLQKVGGFVREELAPPDQHQLADDASLIDAQILDSIALVRLVVFIEATFGLRMKDQDLLPQHFGSIRTIAALIHSRIER